MKSESEHTVAAKVSLAGEPRADADDAGEGVVADERKPMSAAEDGSFVELPAWGEPTGDERGTTAPTAPDATWWSKAKDASGALVPPAFVRPSATPEPSATPIPSSTPWPTSTVPPTPTADVIAAAGRPVRLEIPSIGVDSFVEQVGLTAERAMDVPAAWANVAWYEHGPLPGAVGNAVIAGHLDTSTGGPAVFWMLNRVSPGDEVHVTYEGGNRFTFIVQELVEYEHDAEGDVIDTVFGESLAPNLNLITCQGIWDYGNGTYNKRLVVFTALAPELTVYASSGAVRD